jgi:hypothetical protein
MRTGRTKDRSAHPNRFQLELQENHDDVAFWHDTVLVESSKRLLTARVLLMLMKEDTEEVNVLNSCHLLFHVFCP